MKEKKMLALVLIIVPPRCCGCESCCQGPGPAPPDPTVDVLRKEYEELRDQIRQTQKDTEDLANRIVKMIDKSSKRFNRLMVVGATLVVLLPLIQCLWRSWSVANLRDEIRETRTSNAELREAVISLYGQKNVEFHKAQHKLDQWEAKLDRNQELHGQMQQAEQRLELAKRLVAEHQQIVRDLDELKQQFPELTSGP